MSKNGEFLYVRDDGSAQTVPVVTVAFDGGKALYGSEQLIIEDGIIREKKPCDGIPDLYVTAGFINCHMHWLMRGGPGTFDELIMDTAGKPDQVLEKALAHARACLKLGITFGCDKGPVGYCASHLYRGIMEAINRGEPMTGTIYSTWALMAQRSFGAPYGRIVGSVGEMKIVFLELEATGAGVVKLIPESPLIWGKKTYDFVFSEELFHSARAAAREKNLVFAVHAKGTDTLNRCIAEGADCIEHGIQATREQLLAFQEKNIYLGPTLEGLECRMIHSRRTGQGTETGEYEWEEVCRMVRDAASLNDGRPFTHMLFSSDAGSYVTPHASLRELYLMRLMNWQPAAIFEAATVNGAKCLKQKQRGTLQEGMRADLVYWSKNPLELSQNEWEHLENFIEAVVLNGVVAYRR